MGSNHYKSPALDGHKILYKGKRFWIFEISMKYPFQGYEGVEDRVIIYDKVYGAPVACVVKNKVGFDGKLTDTMDTVEVGGKSLQDLLANTIDKMRFYEKQVAGFISPRTARPYRSQKAR